MNAGQDPWLRWTARVQLLLLGFLLLVLLIPYENRQMQLRILDAIRQVESSGRDDVPDGDGGRAIGPYQIHEVYWRDAVAHDPSLAPAGYQACRRRDYAERVVRAYMQRWVPQAWRHGDPEIVARTHNGGPRGSEKDSTLRYWARVAEWLQSTEP